MKKTDLQSLINSKIRSNPSLIDEVDHADVEDATLNNAYGTPINDTQLTNNIATAVNTTTKKYNITFNKQGSHVVLNGSITKNSMGIVELEEWFSIDNDEYFPNAFVRDKGFTIDGTDVQLVLSTGGLFTVVTPLGASEQVFFNITYNTAE